MKPEDPTLPARPFGRGATALSVRRALDAAQTLPDETLDAVPPEPEAHLPRGSVLGRYVVIDLLGEGGMGVVYAAYDPDLDRKVALKLLRAPGEKRDASEGSARLLREAQALARLSHPNVVAVYDVGRVGDRVFIAMEYVDGPSLKRYLAERPRPWREVLEVFRKAGAGLSAAHACGLVHRDIKPDNIFLRRDGRVCVGDFGLARSVAEGAGARADAESGAGAGARAGAESGAGAGARAGTGAEAGAGSDAAKGAGAAAGGDTEADLAATEVGSQVPTALATPLTESGILLGTPPYMSPEQHRAEPTDHRTDQFSFCVTLYEALYGVRPFAGDGIFAVRRAILAGEVREPPRGTDVPSWVHRAIMRGLETDPARRYPSIDALLAALSRDPARTRRRVALGAAAVAVVAAVAGSLALFGGGPGPCSGGAAELAAVWNPERKATIGAAFAAVGAGAAWARTAELLDDYGRDWVAMHREACEATRVRGEQSEALLDARMLCLDRRRAELDGLAALLARADEKLVRRSVDAALALSDIDDCADLEVLTAHAPPPDDPAVRAEVEAIEIGLGAARASLNAGRHAEARERTTALAERAEKTGFDPVVAEAYSLLGTIERTAGRIEEAERHLFQAALAAEGSRSDDTAARAWTELVLVVGRDRARYDEGMRWAQVAEAAIDRLGRAPGLRSLLHNNRGAILDARSDFEGSEREYKAALAIDERTLEEGDPERAITLANLGNASYRLGHYDDARAYYERALEIRAAAYGPDHPRVAESYVQLGLVYEATGELDEALRAYQTGLAINERVYGPDALPIADSLSAMGGAYHALGLHEKALEVNRRALEIRRAALGDDHPDLALTHNNIAIALKNLGRFDEALEAYSVALDGFVRSQGERSYSAAVTRNNMGEVFRIQNRCREAVEQYRRSLEVLEELLEDDHPVIAHPLTGLGACLVDLGQRRAGLELLERALRMRLARKVSPVELADTQFALARALGARGPARERALELASSARDAWAAAGEGRARDRKAVEAWLARVR